VIGDDSLFPDERWPLGMSWNNIPTRSGTATSALSVNDNERMILVRPGGQAGSPVEAWWREGDEFQPLDNEAVTISGGEEDLRIERLPNAPNTRLHGVTPLSSGETAIRVGVDDPALFAAWRLTQLLKARDVIVEHEPVAQRRSASLADDPLLRGVALEDLTDEAQPVPECRPTTA
jgi:D-alanyl-D-alanine carboxypeptidase/D-alanyl-D-alanine-endopeptidase (penicillin-binding protein 4)